MLQNNRVSAKEISEVIGISKRKVETNIAYLKKQEFIERIGKPKTGYWVVKNK